MAAELFVQPKVEPMHWDTFRNRERKILPKVGAIALDGYVSGPPHFDEKGPFLNANHHEDVNRLATLSTAQQIQQFIRLGMLRAFEVSGSFSPRVYANDCDQDVCLAWYLLDNIELASKPTPQLNRFVQVAGTLDVTSGAYPYPKDMRIIEEQAWVFEPYSELRASDAFAKKDSQDYKKVIADVGARITQHLRGEGKQKKLDIKYEVVGGGDTWKMIVEHGHEGKMGALMDGIDAYVTVRQNTALTWRYTVGRRSEFIPFDIPKIIQTLNEVEGNTEDAWGGANIIAGSPRVGGSKLTPSQVEAIIEQCVQEQQA